MTYTTYRQRQKEKREQKGKTLEWYSKNDTLLNIWEKNKYGPHDTKINT